MTPARSPFLGLPRWEVATKERVKLPTFIDSGKGILV